jgi:hypothetical protein
VQGRILQVLHGPRGDANGAILDDGTTLKLQLPPASLLQRGQSVIAQGWSLSAYGRVVDVQSITPGPQIPAPPPPAGMAPPPPPPVTPRG